MATKRREENEEVDQHNSQRRSKVSTSINTEEATPRVKSLSKEQQI